MVNYVLEIRSVVSKDYIRNKSEQIIGIFTSPSKAIKWIKENGHSWYGTIDKWPKNNFFALCRYTKKNTDDGVFAAFYDKNGEQIM